MGHQEFIPRTAVREEKRQANEALGRSFCKTVAEPLTNSDSSAKRMLGIQHSSGLVSLMLAVPKGNQLDSSALVAELANGAPKRKIVIELATAKSSKRPVGQVVVIDEAQGMDASTLRQALDEIGGNKLHLSKGVRGCNLFGRGLSDVLRAHSEARIDTFDGLQLTTARGKWQKKGWTIEMDDVSGPSKSAFRDTFLNPLTTGTAIRFVINDRKRCHIPDPSDVAYRLANFYRLRLIASDPSVDLVLRQYRAAGITEERIQYDFPVGQVIESFTRELGAESSEHTANPIKIDFLVVRSNAEQKLRGQGLDRDGRENGMLIVDDLDAVYDLTFADPDYEKADFLSHIYGVVRVNGLRKILESYLEAAAPTSPLRPDRDGFNRDHEFSQRLLQFIGDQLRPIYDRERKRLEDHEKDRMSSETKKRIDDALKHLNRYFHRITEISGNGAGADGNSVLEPAEPATFFPRRTNLIAGHGRQVLLLVRETAVRDGSEVVVTASEGFKVQPQIDHIQKDSCPRWHPHKQFLALGFLVSSSEIGRQGELTAMVEGKDGEILEAMLQIETVLSEPMIEVPETLEFRPAKATGQPGRRNTLALYANPLVIPPGHYVRVQIVRRTGSVSLFDKSGNRCEQLDVKLSPSDHQVPGQKVLRVAVPWSGTSWSQHAHVEARVKLGAKQIVAEAAIQLDQPEDRGFFKQVKYRDIDQRAPSVFADGTVTVNINDQVNRLIFGDSQPEFDQRIGTRSDAQQRLASLLLEEASFRGLQQRYDDNKVLFAERREVAVVHDEIDKYKFESAADVYRALTR